MDKEGDVAILDQHISLEDLIVSQKERKKSRADPASQKYASVEARRTFSEPVVPELEQNESKKRNLNRSMTDFHFFRKKSSPDATFVSLEQTGNLINNVQDELEDVQEELSATKDKLLKAEAECQSYKEELRQLKHERINLIENESSLGEEEHADMQGEYEKMRHTRNSLIHQMNKNGSPPKNLLTPLPKEIQEARTRTSVIMDDEIEGSPSQFSSESQFYQMEMKNKYQMAELKKNLTSSSTNVKPRVRRQKSTFFRELGSIGSKAPSDVTEVLNMNELDMDEDFIEEDEVHDGLSEYPAQSNMRWFIEALTKTRIYKNIHLYQVFLASLIILLIIYRVWILPCFAFLSLYFVLKYSASISPLLEENLGPRFPTDCGKSLWLETERGYRIHILQAEVTGNVRINARCNILLIHDLGHSSLSFHSVCRKLKSRLKANIYAMDLQGHGLSGGKRGVFEFRNWIKDVCDASKYLYSKDKKKTWRDGQPPTVLVGVGMGADVALRASLHSHYVEGVIFLGGYLYNETKLGPKIFRYLSQSWAGFFEFFLWNWVKIPLITILDARKTFGCDSSEGGDPRHYTRWKRNPLNVYGIGYHSVRSYLTFNGKSLKNSPLNKAVLVISAEKDTITTPDHIYKCFQHVPGKLKRYFCLPNGQHSDLITFSGPVVSVLESYIHHFIVQNKVNEDWNCPIKGVDHEWLSGGGAEVSKKAL